MRIKMMVAIAIALTAIGLKSIESSSTPASPAAAHEAGVAPDATGPEPEPDADASP